MSQQQMRARMIGGVIVCLTAGVVLPVTASAQTGVSDDRVSLPDGPGSIGGMGESASLDPNMGLLSYGVGVEVPAGFSGVTPNVRLSYSSGAGASVVGIGWNTASPYVERMTSRGLPHYDAADDFAVDGAQELVLLPGSNPPTYRSRFEGGFTRYTWLGTTDGTRGYWRAELPNGLVSYYGASADGASVATARVEGAVGTFRYHLVETVDPLGHALKYEYQDFAGYTLLRRLGWVHNQAGVPRYTLEYDYEAREDFVSDCKQGFCEVLQHRLKTLTVVANAQTLRRYVLTYEPYADSGGSSRLTRVEHFSGTNTPHPISFNFGYSRGLGGVCTGASCQAPFLVQMGTAGQVANGRATLLDINGDGLPDIVDAPGAGVAHTFYLSNLAMDGTHTFSAPQQSTHGASMELGRASVQLLDVDGDGFTDMADTKNSTLLLNRGTGDWLPMGMLTGGLGGLPDLDDDATDGVRTISFLDYDNDKKIDIIQATRAATNIWRNTGTGFVQDMGVEDIGAGFDLDELQFTDMNGDGLLDPTVMNVGEVRYRLNLGFGKWGPWVPVGGLDLQASEVDNADLEDINGDGISDVIVVLATQVKYFINRNGSSFQAPQVITTVANGSIPDRATHPVVLYADMNGNGSSDVVWVNTNGQVTYLELFPARPNLISRIENGVGQVAQITYGTGVQHMARDGGTGAWLHRIPHSMIVVDSVDEYDLLNNVHQIMSYKYHDAYYDGVDKQFRGFERVEQETETDATQLAGRTSYTFDLGVMDRYRAGLKLSTARESNGQPVDEMLTTFSECTVDGIPAMGLKFPIKYMCPTLEARVIKEGRPMTEWVTTQTRKTYDGNGNVTLEEELGVTSIGPGGCGACTAESGMNSGACGPMCLGDERFTETSFVPLSGANGRWILGAVFRTRSRTTASTTNYAETRTYFDGPDFAGLPEGQLTLGLPSRVTQRRYIDQEEVIATQRARFDANGNAVESLDPLGVPGGDEHRSTWTYDDTGLNVTRTEFMLRTAAGTPYQLRRDYLYHPQLDLPIEATTWMVVEGGEVRTPRISSYYTYDQFRRLTSIASPGDAQATPTGQFSYELANPVSRIVIRRRSVSGGALDVEQVKCVDGRGRTFQQRSKLTDTRWSVNGFTQYNKRGQVVRQYQPYEATTGVCDMAPPASGVNYEERHYDGVGRLVMTTHPDDTLYGTRSQERTEYRPLATLNWGEGASEATDPAYDTYSTIRTDGLDRTVAIERLLQRNGTPVVHRVHYDATGQIGAFTDPDGAVRRQTLDLFGNLLRGEDGDRGVRTYEYLANGQYSRSVDATGKVRRYEYDGLNRLAREYVEGSEATTSTVYTHDRPLTCPITQCTNTAGTIAEVTYPVDDGVGTDWFGYDSRLRTSFQRRTVLGRTFDFANTFDNLGRLIRADYPKGQTIQYTYDADNRVTSAPSYVNGVTYDARGLPSEMRLANGVTTSQTFDGRMRLASQRSVKTGSTPVVDWTYGRDRSGNLTSIMDGRPELASPMGGAQFAYDAFDRMLTATLDSGRTAYEETLTLTYANNDNILSNRSSKGALSKGHVGDYTYGQNAGPHAVTQAGTLAFEYDAAGRITRRGSQNFEWDALGRLTRVTNGAAELSRFNYGPKGDRLIKRSGSHITLYLAPEYEIRDGVSQLTVNVGGAAAARVQVVDHQTELFSDVAPASLSGTTAAPLPDGEINAADAWLSEAVTGGVLTFNSTTTISQTRQLLAASARRMLFGTEPVRTFMHFNHQGSTAAVTDADGGLVQRTEYFPFGQVRHQEGGLPEEALFTGKELDAETGLINFGPRHLDPITGRWMETDPAFELMDEQLLNVFDEMANPYTYVRNNPVSARDSTGQFAELIFSGVVVGMVVGGVLAAASDKLKGKPVNPVKVVVGVLLGGIAGGIAAAGGAAALLTAVAVSVVSKAAEITSYWITYGIQRLFGVSPKTADKWAGRISAVVGIGAGAFTAVVDASGIVVNKLVEQATSAQISDGVLTATDTAIGVGQDLYEVRQERQAAKKAGAKAAKKAAKAAAKSAAQKSAAKAGTTATASNAAAPSAAPTATPAATGPSSASTTSRTSNAAPTAAAAP